MHVRSVIPMSSTSIPRSAELDCPADPSTTFNRGQKRVIRTAINYCSVIDSSIADLSRLRNEVENDRVLRKRERRALQRIVNKYGNQRLDPSERRLVGWVKSDLWDAHRPGDVR